MQRDTRGNRNPPNLKLQGFVDFKYKKYNLLT